MDRPFGIALLVCAACGAAPTPGPATTPTTAQAAPSESSSSSPWLVAAREAAAWLDEVRAVSASGAHWRPDVLDPEASDPLNIADGTAGIVYVYLGLAAATGEERYLETARAGADYLVSALPDADLERPISFYYGYGGISFVLSEVARATGVERYRDAAKEAAEQVKALVIRSEGKTRFDERFSELLFGDAGAILFLDWAGQRFEDPDATALALEAARSLVSDAIDVGPDKLNWSMRRDKELLLPNFTHGAAGVGYVLAGLNDPALTAAAIEAGNYLDSVAVSDADGYRLPYGWPLDSWKGRFDLGFAHGPAGAARYFVRMWRTTGEMRYRDAALACARAIALSGAPGELRAGFGPGPIAPGYRFGLASALEALVEASRLSDEPAFLDRARVMAKHLLALSTVVDGQRYWSAERPVFVERPGEPARYTGLFMGSAGYLLALLRLEERRRGERFLPPLPDYPWHQTD